MGALSVSTGDILDAASEFEAASRKSQEIISKLDEVTTELKGKWSGPAQEAFYRHHNEWQMIMKGQAALLSSISMELRALAERYQTADK